jgi:hypothetical protein
MEDICTFSISAQNSRWRKGSFSMPSSSFPTTSSYSYSYSIFRIGPSGLFPSELIWNYET